MNLSIHLLVLIYGLPVFALLGIGACYLWAESREAIVGLAKNLFSLAACALLALLWPLVAVGMLIMAWRLSYRPPEVE